MYLEDQEHCKKCKFVIFNKETINLIDHFKG